MVVSSTLFEVSWEVCNKVGGIFTVINSKAPYVLENFMDYFLVGPYLENSSKRFIPGDVPSKFENAVIELEVLGIKVHFGKTNVRGDVFVDVILVEHLGYVDKLNEIKKILWDSYKIDSLNSSWYDFDEAILWSWVCGIAIEKLSVKIEKPVIVHCHEWMSGGVIFYLKGLQENVSSNFKTVFTTHATMLGRSVSGSGGNLKLLDGSKSVDDISYEVGVATKHQTERALANCCDCFTTVSDITNDECKKFYGKSVDVLLYNGFDNHGIELIGDLNDDFLKSRLETNKFLSGFFHDFYDVDLDKMKLVYTSGRNEFRNKGYDVFIRALGRLNESLKASNSEVGIINMLLVIVSSDLKPNSSVFDSVSHFNDGLDKGNQDFAPICTHDLQGHEILDLLHEVGLNNHRDDKVKNIFIPIYLNGSDGWINRKYYDFVTGFDLGVFPSFYEPWGYTPLESISYGVPTITSNLSGFGRFILEEFGDSCPSVEVLNRVDCDDEAVIKELYCLLKGEVDKSMKSKVLDREIAKHVALKYDWSEFISNYLDAYSFALKK